MIRFRGGLLAVLLLCSSATASEPIEIHGYVQGRLTSAAGAKDRLELRRTRVIVSGEPVSRFSYTLQVDMLKNPILMDASVNWNADRALRLTFGQFKIPFGAESLRSDDQEEPIERALAVNALSPGRDLGVQARDAGVQFSGAIHAKGRPMWEYAAGVFRGQTLIHSAARHFPAVAGRLMVRPVSGIAIGGDWYSSFSAPAFGEKRRREVEGSYTKGPLILRIEHIWARDGHLNRQGGYALGVRRFSRRWEGLTRVDWLTADTTRANATTRALVAGANYYLGKHVKVQVNWGVRRDPHPERLTGVFLAQTQLSF